MRAGLVSATVFILGTGLGPVLGGALTGYGPGPGFLAFGVNLVLLAVVFLGLGSVREPGPFDRRRGARRGPRRRAPA